MTDAAEFLAVFREEATGRLETIDAALVDLEAGGGDSNAIDVLFREFHTIKGAAGLVGMSGVHALAHAVEDLLGAVRDAGTPVADVANTLLRAVDELRAQVAGEADVPSPGLIEELMQQRAAVGTPAATLAATPPPFPGRPTTAPQPSASPPTSPDPGRGIRVPAGKLDRVLTLVGETVVHRQRLEHTLDAERLRSAHELADELLLGDRLLDDLQRAALTLRTVPLRSIVGPFPRAVRDIAVDEGKEAELEIVGGETELDRVVLERLADPLVHMLRNAVHHGIESPSEREPAGKPARGRIVLQAEQRGALVAVTIADDGRGVDERLLADAEQGVALADVLARPGFSTASAVTDVAGRGVGLDAVKREVESLGGRMEVYSEPREGTEVVLLLPLTLAVLDALVVERDGEPFAFPRASILEALRADAPLELGGRQSVQLRGEVVPLVDLADVVGAHPPPLGPSPPALVVSAALGRIALMCDRVLGEEDVVVKSLGPLLTNVRGYFGAAVLRDGRVMLIVDPGALGRLPVPSMRPADPSPSAPPSEARSAAVVLVVEDSVTVRALQRSILEAAGYRVETASDGAEALTRVQRDGIGLVVTDVDMPGMDGIALIQAIRRDAERAALPVVIVTARAGEEDRRRGLEAGADAYIEKSRFDQRALLEAVERLLGG